MPRHKQPSPPAAPDRRERFVKIGGALLVGAAVLAAAELRIWASLDDFWLDEIWSWLFASQVESAGEILTRIRHDNNHFLNTWIIYVLGADSPWIVFRLPAVAAGVGTVLLCGAIAWRWGRSEAVAALLIAGFSFLLIQYSSEARGYAYVLLFSAAALAIAQRAIETPRWWLDALFAGIAVLGFLAHVTFVSVYAALVAWAVWRAFRDRGIWSARHAAVLGEWIAVPLGFLAWLYVVNLRYLAVGGGEIRPWAAVVVQTLSLTAGGPPVGPGGAVVAAVVVIAAVVGLIRMRQAGSDLWLPLGLGVLVMPALVLATTRPVVLYPRYFLVNVLLLQLLLAWLLGWWFRSGQPGKMLCIAALAAMLIGNGTLTARFLEHGRGGYQAAVEYMLAHTSGEALSVGSDHDFRNGLVLHYYYRRSGSEKPLIFHPMGEWPPGGPEWLLTHDAEPDYSPPPMMRDAAGNTYQLEKVFPYAGLSGWHWGMYRNLR